MANQGRSNMWSASGLRTRYFPKSRIGQGLISMAPWVSMLLLMFCFMMVDRQLVLQPGVVINLPRAPFREGTGLQSSLVAAVLSVPSSTGSGREELIFFDDKRYRVKNEQQMQNLRVALSAACHGHADAGLIIEADQRVLHGTVVSIMNMALVAGIRQVNVAARPE